MMPIINEILFNITTLKRKKIEKEKKTLDEIAMKLMYITMCVKEKKGEQDGDDLKDEE